MRILITLWAAALLSGCGSAPGACGEAECASICAGKDAAPAGTAATAAKAGAATTLTPFEKSLVQPMLDDIREGVRPWEEGGVGICEGQGKTCDRFLGMEAGELPEGKYMVRADVRVPKVGEVGTWKLKLDTECVTTKKTANGETTSTSNNSREYDVRYAGEDRGYRLSPLYTIDSPSKGGARACTWKLTAPHPDGDKVFQGSWSTPAAE
ncbi:MAG: hypothetical protein JXX28_09755 [Deltaproteobacteria bacterium]|nr:hypothetical protein [Deltaproteobacteria bacterium]